MSALDELKDDVMRELIEAQRAEIERLHGIEAAAKTAADIYEARIEQLEAGIEEYACTGTDHPCGCHTLLTADKARIERLEAALQAVMEEYRDGYGLRCVEQVRAALAGKEG